MTDVNLMCAMSHHPPQPNDGTPVRCACGARTYDRLAIDPMEHVERQASDDFPGCVE